MGCAKSKNPSQEEQQQVVVPAETKKKKHEEPEIVKKKQRPLDYDEQMRNTYPEGNFKPGELAGSDGVYTDCKYIPDNQRSRKHYLEFQDIDPGSVNQEQFDDWCRDNDVWNAVGKHEAFLDAEELESDNILQNIIDKYGVYVTITDAFLNDADEYVRAVVIKGNNSKDVKAAGTQYKKLTAGEFSGGKTKIEIIYSGMSAREAMNQMLLYGNSSGDQEWDISSCETASIGDEPNCGMENMLSALSGQPGLREWENGIFEYIVLLPFSAYKLHYLPMKRFSRSYHFLPVVLRKSDSIIFKGNPCHQISIIGLTKRGVLFTRNDLISRSKAFNFAQLDVKNVEVDELQIITSFET